jgi:hypothetical protein
MADETDEPTSTRDEHGRWRKGCTPNPKGRPPGSRHLRHDIGRRSKMQTDYGAPRHLPSSLSSV